MNLKKIAVIAAAACLAVFCLVGCGGNANKSSDLKLMNEGKLMVATSPDYPPFENLEDGEIVGLEVDIIKAAADKLDLEVEFVPMQFDAIIPAIQSGGQADIGLSGFTVTPERAKVITFTESYYVDDQAICAMKNSGITEDNAEEKLANATIGVQSGTSGEAYVEENYPNAKIVPFGNSTDAFAAMQAGQVQAVCTNAAVVKSMLNAYSDAQVVLEIATGEDYAIVVSQDNKALTDALNKVLKEMISDGTIQKLTEESLS